MKRRTKIHGLFCNKKTQLLFPPPDLPNPKPHISLQTQNPSLSQKPLLSQTPFFLKPPRPHFISASVNVSKDQKPISKKPQSRLLRPRTTPSPPHSKKSQNSTDGGSRSDSPSSTSESTSVGQVGTSTTRPLATPRTQFRRAAIWEAAGGLAVPDVRSRQSFFVSKSVEFGLGGNALTSGQKAVLIYGSLFLLFAQIQPQRIIISNNSRW